ncbi:MAG: hypothetical protein JW730_20920 [Anaerolineales bacterium]|nr:hypothetical protein [Anaerolineales bacterium]
MNLFTLDNLFLLLTGLLAAYLCWYFWQRYTLHKALHNIYYQYFTKAENKVEVE